MSDTEEFMSLSQLASLDTDSITALTSRSYLPGVYIVDGQSAAITQQESRKEGEPPLFNVKFAYEVLACTPTDRKKTEEAEAMVGRDIRDSYTIWPKDLIESLGLLKGRYQLAGIKNEGLPIGGVESQEPGWVDMMVGQRFSLKIGTYKDKQGETRNNFTWGPAPQAELEVA